MHVHVIIASQNSIVMMTEHPVHHVHTLASYRVLALNLYPNRFVQDRGGKCRNADTFGMSFGDRTRRQVTEKEEGIVCMRDRVSTHCPVMGDI